MPWGADRVHGGVHIGDAHRGCYGVDIGDAMECTQGARGAHGVHVGSAVGWIYGMPWGGYRGCHGVHIGGAMGHTVWGGCGGWRCHPWVPQRCAERDDPMMGLSALGAAVNWLSSLTRAAMLRDLQCPHPAPKGGGAEPELQCAAAPMHGGAHVCASVCVARCTRCTLFACCMHVTH